jgi:DNA-directed RNA polymerase specialized sigma subunit
MRIAWKYINKADATIAVIRDYDNMRVIINTTPEEIKAAFDKMSAPASSRLTGMPGARNPHAAEKKMTDGIDRLDHLSERYCTAVEFMAWVGPAWETLSDKEQMVLSEFYGSGNLRSGANARLQSRLDTSEATIERLRASALSRLITLLFGK